MKYQPTLPHTIQMCARQLGAIHSKAGNLSTCFRSRCMRLWPPITIACWCLMLPAQALSSQLLAVTHSVEFADPNKAASELNHHIAGAILIAIGLMVICGRKYEKFKFMQWLWPLLFIAAGLFLAAWSDEEIWPRGDRSWLWLIGRDAEARQHKIYAVLLITIGLVEYLRAHGRLSRRWATWLFPCLAVFGGVFLFFHDHGGHSTAALPHTTAATTEAHTEAMQVAAAHSGAHPGSYAEMSMHHHGQELAMAGGSKTPDALPSQRSSQGLASSSSETHRHDHSKDGPMWKIQRQHMWFAIIGFCVALFKYLDDMRPSGKIARYPWAQCIIALGVLLVLYVE
jgi:cell division protein FtsW (lipid II flippase)